MVVQSVRVSRSVCPLDDLDGSSFYVIGAGMCRRRTAHLTLIIGFLHSARCGDVSVPAPQLARPAIHQHSSPLGHSHQPMLPASGRSLEGGHVEEEEEAKGYELMAPSFAYEFSEKADKAFNATSSAMRAVSLGFMLHSIVEGVGVLVRTHLSGEVGTLLQFGNVVDEAVYAYLIYQASYYFNAVAKSQGRDIENLMDGVREQTLLWRRMRKPLFVKSALMVLQLSWMLYSRAFLKDASPQDVFFPLLRRVLDLFVASGDKSAARAVRLLKEARSKYTPPIGGYERYLVNLG